MRSLVRSLVCTCVVRKPPEDRFSCVEAHVAIAYLIITMLDPDIEFMHIDCVDLTSHQSKVYKQDELDLHC